MPTRIHLDTDLGGDPDDVGALAMILGWPDVEITGVTTTSDALGLRAAYARHVLDMAGRGDVPVAVGAGASMTNLAVADPVVSDERYWPRGLVPEPSSTGAALDLLSHSIEHSATIVAIGAWTNLAQLEVLRPGSLGRVPVVAMGGWIDPPDIGFPRWGPEMDWNIQFDPRAAEIVFAVARDLTLATLTATMQAQLRRAEIPRLRAAGPLGEMIASQSEAWAEDRSFQSLGRGFSSLPDDLINFHWDPVTAAVALGWPGASIEPMRLLPVIEGDILRLDRDPAGRLAKVVTAVDGDAFSEQWLTAVEAIHSVTEPS